jgi:hypothetical protein
MRPADDIESLAYVLAFLAAGRLPWQGKPAALALSMKQELLTSSSAATELTDDLQCATVAAALRELWAEVRRCHGRAGASVDYGACLAALGGSADADTFSELSFLSALGGGSSEMEEEVRTPASSPAASAKEEEAKRAWMRKLDDVPTWVAVKLDVPTWGMMPTSSPAASAKEGVERVWMRKLDVPTWDMLPTSSPAASAKEEEAKRAWMRKLDVPTGGAVKLDVPTWDMMPTSSSSASIPNI